jgi:hypothetical protein
VRHMRALLLATAMQATRAIALLQCWRSLQSHTTWLLV